MGLFDNLKKKAEQLASDAIKIADKTLKDASAWTEKAVKDTKTWTQHAIKDTKEWTEKVAKDTKEWTEQAIKDTSDWTEQAAKDTKDWTEQTIKDVDQFSSEIWNNKDKYIKDLKIWSEEMPDKIKNYIDYFNVEDFWNKITDTAKKVGQDIIFMALTIYYTILEIFQKNNSEEEKFLEINSVNSKVKVKAKAQNRAALGIVHAYLKLNPNITLAGLKEAFPNNLAPDNGVEELFVEEEVASDKNKKMPLYFNKDDELLKLMDGSKIAVSMIWTKPSLDRIQNKASLYEIELENLPLSPNKIGFEIETI